METTQTSETVVQRVVGENPEAQKAHENRFNFNRSTTWGVCLGVLVLAIVGVANVGLSRFKEVRLANASEVEARAALEQEWPEDASAEYFEVLSEQAQRLMPDDYELGYRAVRFAASKDAKRAYVWARFAYLEVARTGEVSQNVVAGIWKSMEACPLCDLALVRWRFSFVLEHWDDMPERVRRTAFEHADLLRWSGEDAEFLAEMRTKSKFAGIPYDEFRAQVETPVRTLDIILD